MAKGDENLNPLYHVRQIIPNPALLPPLLSLFAVLAMTDYC